VQQEIYLGGAVDQIVGLRPIQRGMDIGVFP
jgi:hypothetical protein